MYEDCPKHVKDFLFYMETIKGRSPNTVKGYYIDLRTFFRFIKQHKNLCEPNTMFTDIEIFDVTIEQIRQITLSDVYEFLHFVSADRSNQAKTRARKVSCIRVFFKYLSVNMGLLEENPVLNLEIPNIKKTLPKYLTLENCYELLQNIEGPYKERDFCMVTFFLNCGMRLSELVGMNQNDIKETTVLLRGKGNKERIVYLNQACLDALEHYLEFKKHLTRNARKRDKSALFLSRNGNRISKRQVERIVEGYLQKSGLSGMGYSVHKLRHTAATIMYQHGNVDVRVLQEILGHTNLGTTQIYTHVSNDQMKHASESTPLSKIKMNNKQNK